VRSSHSPRLQSAVASSQVVAAALAGHFRELPDSFEQWVCF